MFECAQSFVVSFSSFFFIVIQVTLVLFTYSWYLFVASDKRIRRYTMIRLRKREACMEGTVIFTLMRYLFSYIPRHCRIECEIFGYISFVLFNSRILFFRVFFSPVIECMLRCAEWVSIGAIWRAHSDHTFILHWMEFYQNMLWSKLKRLFIYWLNGWNDIESTAFLVLIYEFDSFQLD